MFIFYQDNGESTDFNKHSQITIQFGCFKLFVEYMGWQQFYTELVDFIKAQDLNLDFASIDDWVKDVSVENFHFKILLALNLNTNMNEMLDQDLEESCDEELATNGTTSKMSSMVNVLSGCISSDVKVADELEMPGRDEKSLNVPRQKKLSALSVEQILLPERQETLISEMPISPEEKVG